MQEKVTKSECKFSRRRRRRIVRYCPNKKSASTGSVEADFIFKSLSLIEIALDRAGACVLGTVGENQGRGLLDAVLADKLGILVGHELAVVYARLVQIAARDAAVGTGRGGEEDGLACLLLGSCRGTCWKTCAATV